MVTTQSTIETIKEPPRSAKSTAPYCSTRGARQSVTVRDGSSNIERRRRNLDESVGGEARSVDPPVDKSSDGPLEEFADEPVDEPVNGLADGSADGSVGGVVGWSVGGSEADTIGPVAVLLHGQGVLDDGTVDELSDTEAVGTGVDDPSVAAAVVFETSVGEELRDAVATGA